MQLAYLNGLMLSNFDDKSLGLKRGELKLVQHQKKWLQLGKKLTQFINEKLSFFHVEVHHIGSSSIPNLMAKPILDLAVGFQNQNELEAIVQTLIQVGFIDRGYQEVSKSYLIVAEKAPKIRFVHLHIVPFKSVEWQNFIAFKRILSKDEKLVKTYSQLKKELIDKSVSREAYRALKSTFIRQLLQRNH